MQKTKLIEKPKRYLTQFAEKFPDCWKHVDELRGLKQSQLPAHCFLSDDLCEVVFARGNYTWYRFDLYLLSALSAWRTTQGIYRFHNDLFAELIDMEIGPLPAEVLKRLPEWCIYLELKNVPQLNDLKAEGVFVQFASKSSNGESELRLFFVPREESHIDRLFPAIIPLTGSLMSGIEKHIDSVIAPHYAKKGIAIDYDVKLIHKNFSAVISLILYICSVNADISGMPIPPVAKKTKNGPRWFPPASASVWDVGFRDGPALVRSLHQVTKGEGGAGNTTRPHVRRAHWHHYWTGSKENKELILKWLAPTLVNVQSPEDLIPTNKAVESPDARP